MRPPAVRAAGNLSVHGIRFQGLKLAQAKGVGYVLLDPSPKVSAVIELSQLHNFFDIEISSGDACAAAE